MLKTQAVFISIVTLLVLGACDEPADAVKEDRIRAIKSYTVSEPAGADIRRYSGTIEASDTSGLAFAVAGTVASVAVKQGDRVTAGQVLATLDTVPFDLDVQAAAAQLASAQAGFNEKTTELDRQSQLFSKGWVAKAALDQAQAAFDAARADLNLARSRLGTAQRDLSRTKLTAPFDGLIAERSIEPFEEVSGGTPLFQINSEGALEVTLSVPDNSVSRLAIGVPVQINVSTVANCGCRGVLTEIGSASGSANAVTVKASVIDAGASIIPGMAAEVSVPLSGDNNVRGFLVPLSAIAPGDDTVAGYLFKFDPETRTVAKVAVQEGGGISNNLIEVTEGVTAGDIIASAGVSFLRDGQAVKLMGE